MHVLSIQSKTTTRHGQRFIYIAEVLIMYQSLILMRLDLSMIGRGTLKDAGARGLIVATMILLTRPIELISSQMSADTLKRLAVFINTSITFYISFPAAAAFPVWFYLFSPQ
jgi:membrane-bound ClpP family serine protease